MILLMLSALSGPFHATDDLSKLMRDLPHAQTRAAASVVDIQSGRTVFSWNADQPLTPASVAKVFAMCAAITELGADFRFRTRVGLRGDDVFIVR